jgi:aquaporin Z
MRKSLAEALGTFALVFVGTGSIIVNDLLNGAITHVGVSLAFGLVVMAFIYALVNVSGAHFNPAVSLAFFLLGKITRKELILYSVSQLTGAIVASTILKVVFPTHQTLGMTVPHLPILSSFLIEVILTFFLLFVVLNVSKLGEVIPSTIGLAVGATVAFDALIGGALTGASMNPARSIAPAIVVGNMGDIWLYVAAPIIGSRIAVALSKQLYPNTQFSN